MSSRKARPNKRFRQLRKVLIVLALFSLVQYLSTGTVRWPVALYQKVTATLSEYASRPEAGWRRAAKSLEEIGAAREGESVTDFDLTGRVVRVADGDTVSILDSSNTQHKVRLYGIDTPERDQPYGKAAKKVLIQLIDDQPVGVVIVETDSYGRLVGTLYQNNRNINVAMVASGYAWWYQYYAPYEHALQTAEQQARAQRLGLWAEPNPVAPWDWRRNKR
ncbi:Thermonuclease [Halioglobus japonicus]|nr:Thermonuclease [Halioglobus japonicus]